MLRLAAALAERGVAKEGCDLCRDLALKHVQSADADQRVAAIQLVSRLATRDQSALLTRLLPLLKDSAGPVRRAALAALGRSRDLLPDEDTLPFLHDADPDVQRLAELTLRSRGLPESHIVLARLISDPDPAGRLQVFEALHRAPDLDAGVWLRRLTEDTESAVRAAAIRAACQDFHVDLTDRLRQMAQDDPSETVRSIAQTYLRLSLARLER
jgi:HEAT repeat protein